MSTSIRLTRLLAFSGALALLVSFGESDAEEQIDKGLVGKSIYTSRELGWTIEIPKGWTVVSEDKLDGLDKKGLDAIENVAGSIDYSGLKHLISFSKNKFNIFQSTSEPFDIEYEGQWEENNSALRDLLLVTYKDQGLRAKASEISIENVSGLDFQKYEFTIYSPKGSVIINQLMYSRLINGLDFGVAINYNNEIDKNILLGVWRSSRFDSNYNNK
ncbi:MAG TPA: hypothetical protein ENI67_10435 [Gammaproteobacteria bacterium]|nr:hypothetical protein [Gammaproteobacteria bacterium]